MIDGKENHVCLLRRSLYGLKQSARVWNRAIHQVLIDANYVQSRNDPCFYSLNVEGKFCFVLIYVDDLILAGRHEELLHQCERTLSSKFKIKNLGEIRNYLGLRIDRNLDGNFMVNQTSYIMKVVDI